MISLDKLEGMSAKKREKYLQRMFAKIDWGLHTKRVNWILNVPKCLCEPCYKCWLEEGRELYSDDLERYNKIVSEQNSHRQQRQSAKDLTQYDS